MGVRTQIPDECQRTQNIKVSDEFIMVLKHALNGGKSEKLPTKSHYPLYIGTDLLEQMNVADSQIIWGRRGTGKTHLLNAFTQMINEDIEDMKLAYYISCDNIKLDTPVNITFDNDMQRMKYLARETYKCLLINLVEQMIDSYQELLKEKRDYSKRDWNYKKEFQKNVDNRLTKLLEISLTGVPKIIETNEIKSVDHAVQNMKERSGGIEGELSITNFLCSIKGFFSRNRKSIGEDVTNNKYEQKIVYSFSLSEIQKEINKLVEVLGIDMLYICIDELWLIDDKNTISFQPLFLDYLRQTFFGQKKVSIKIASIRETTKLNSKTTVTNNFGLQSGHDIIELANLDSIQYEEDITAEKFLNILTMRINYFSEINGYNTVYEPQYVLETLFKKDRYFKKMVSMSNSIPRNFLRILQLALLKINYNLDHYFIHLYLISDVVMEIYGEERRSNLPFNENSVYHMINQYIEFKRSIFFLISNDQVKRYYVEINNLIYTEIIHRIPSSITPNKIMDRYKAYFVDAGKYLYFIKEVDKEAYLSALSDFSLVIPGDLTLNPEKYIIDLEKVSADYIECPNCGAAINIGNPVYKRHNCCNICGFDFQPH